jgi:predicted TIM-barrel fold metal-dependent hydrolase
MLVDDWVIDCDTHITEPGDVWVDRLPSRWADDAPRLVRLDNGRDVWRFGTAERLVPLGHTAVAGWPKPFPAAPRNLDEVPPAAYDANARLDYMDEVGIWAMALYPNIGGFGNESFLELGDPDLMLACVRAYNDWLHDWVAVAPHRYIPIMATPYWDVAATVAEVERCVELGHRGILFTGEPQELGFPLLGDAHWNPLWEVASATGLPSASTSGAATS